MCGISAILYKNNYKNATEIYESLLSIQHRGQDGAGIGCYNKNEYNILNGKGLICNVFNEKMLKDTQGNMFIGHTRYKTNNIYDSYQPFRIYNNSLDILFCHNGNIINIEDITNILKEEFNVINTNEVSDSYLFFQLIYHYLNKLTNNNELLCDDLVELSKFLQHTVKGSYSIIMCIKNFGLVVIKDINGIRPLVYGRNENNDILISSESCSLNNVLEYTLIREVNPGETIIFNDNEEFNYQGKCNMMPCLFEYIYFSRLDSILYDISIYNFRYLQGRMSGEKILKENLSVDFIIPTPETSRVYAYGMSAETGIPIQECIIKNRYVNRTFIDENKRNIKKSIKRKFSVIHEIVKGKNVILVDDSVVRGNTSREVIKLLKESGVNNVYFCSAAPKINNANHFGIFIEKKEELITYNNDTDEKIAHSIGANKIFYNDLNDTVKLINSLNKNIINMEVSMFLQ